MYVAVYVNFEMATLQCCHLPRYFLAPHKTQTYLHLLFYPLCPLSWTVVSVLTSVVLLVSRQTHRVLAWSTVPYSDRR